MDIGISNVNLIVTDNSTGEEPQIDIQNIPTVHLQPSQTNYMRYKNINNVSIKLKECEGLENLRELVRRQQVSICIKTIFEYLVEARSIKEIFKPKQLYIKVGRGNQKSF